MKKVLVIIPTYNEAGNIDRVVRMVETIAARTGSSTMRLLIVDDMSPDGTAEHVRTLQKKYDNINLISGKKAGLGKAYIRGLTYALDHEAFDACIMMDGDMSHNPKDIPTLLKSLDQGADYVIGSRYITGGTIPGDWPLVRIINSRVANFIARTLTGDTDMITDLTGGFKAIRREALAKIDLNSIKVSGYVFQVSLLHAFVSKGFVVKEVPITFTNRDQGVSKLKLHEIIEFVYCAYKLNPDAPVQRIVRFCLVGTCGSIVNLGVLTLLVKLVHLDTVYAAGIAIEISILFNFSLNHIYTFKAYGAPKTRPQKDSINTLLSKAVKFNIGALGGATISLVTFTLLNKGLGVNYILADIIAILIAMSWNYFVSTRFIWKVVDQNSV